MLKIPMTPHPDFELGQLPVTGQCNAAAMADNGLPLPGPNKL